jgi:low temperature requirement protein LtrA
VLARQTGRPFRTQVAQAACCLFSTICCIIATAIPFTTQTQCAVKIGFLYAGIGTEMLGTTVVSRHFDFARMPSERLAERMSTFTLIILGEGILGLLRAIDKVTLAFAGYDSWLYFNTFCIIAIMFQLFFFSFSGFSKHLWVGRTRSTIWTLLHFPFHLVLLLMMSALKNNVVGLAFDRAVRIGRKMVEQLSLTAAGLLPTELTGSQRWDVLFISQLNLQPDALQEREILLNATELNSKLPLDLGEALTSMQSTRTSRSSSTQGKRWRPWRSK